MINLCKLLLPACTVAWFVCWQWCSQAELAAEAVEAGNDARPDQGSHPEAEARQAETGARKTKTRAKQK